MARIIAFFDSYDAAHRAARALAEQVTPSRVAYVMKEGDQGRDGMEGFYPGITPDQGPGAGAEEDGAARTHTGEAARHRFAVTGTDSLYSSPSLLERLTGLGLSARDAYRLLDRLEGGGVAAVFRFEGPGDRAMELLARNGASEVHQV